MYPPSLKYPPYKLYRASELTYQQALMISKWNCKLFFHDNPLPLNIQFGLFFQYGNDFKNQGASFDFERRNQGCIFCICISKSQRGQTKAALFSSSEFTHTVLLCGEVGIYIHLQEASPRVHFVKQQLRSPFMLSGHLGNAKLKDKNHAPPHSVCLGAPKPKLSHCFKVLQASPLQT